MLGFLFLFFTLELLGHRIWALSICIWHCQSAFWSSYTDLNFTQLFTELFFLSVSYHQEFKHLINSISVQLTLPQYLIRMSMFLYFKFLIWEKKRKRWRASVNCFTLQMPLVPEAEPWSKTGTRNPTQVSHTGGQNAISWAITTALQGLHWQEARAKN